MTILERILEAKRKELLSVPDDRVSVDRLQEVVDLRGGVRPFAAALRQPRNGWIGVIAELKRASPTAGLIRSDFDPVALAIEYERAGADCISILTDEAFFQGRLEYLKAVRQVVSIPLLRKDFIIDERQILEAVEWGADAILLIVSILSDVQLSHLMELCYGCGLEVLVEVHDELELERALRAGARLIGVNNRDLRTFCVDLQATRRVAEALAKLDPTGQVLLVAESGIRQSGDVARLWQWGAKAILVGECLMRHPQPGEKLKELVRPGAAKGGAV